MRFLFSVQRLFSIFPNGWPGRGLLILRTAAGGLLLAQGVAMSIFEARGAPAATAGMAIAAGFLLLIGLWTPISCLLAIVAESWLLFAGGVATQPAVLLISISAALAMLGPGSSSLDAILFGRRRLDIH
jgi:putative oxidoreductase